MTFVGLGVPLSWHKLAVGKDVHWLGLSLDLRVPAWLLPSIKIDKIL